MKGYLTIQKIKITAYTCTYISWFRDYALYFEPDTIAWSVACLLHMQGATKMITTFGTTFHGNFSLLLLIEKEQLSATGKRIGTKYW